MIALSEFLAKKVLEDAVVADKMQPALLEAMKQKMAAAIEDYKKYLIADQPKTVGWKMREQEMIIALERMEAPAIKRKDAKCGDCNNTGEPCGSCGEFHRKYIMCPPHEVRSSRYNSCPTCGRFYWQCKRCGLATIHPETVRHHICHVESIKAWNNPDKIMVCETCDAVIPLSFETVSNRKYKCVRCETVYEVPDDYES